MTVEGVRNEYISQLTRLTNGFAAVRCCPGVWSVNEVQAYASGDLPALYIATLSISRVQEENGSLRGDVQLGMYVLARSSAQTSAENVALGLVEEVAKHYKQVRHDDFIDGGTWDDASNLFSGTMQEIDLALWALRITQKVWFTRNRIPTIGDIELKAGGKKV